MLCVCTELGRRAGGFAMATVASGDWQGGGWVPRENDRFSSYSSKLRFIHIVHTRDRACACVHVKATVSLSGGHA